MAASWFWADWLYPEYPEYCALAGVTSTASRLPGRGRPDSSARLAPLAGAGYPFLATGRTRRCNRKFLWILDAEISLATATKPAVY